MLVMGMRLFMAIYGNKAIYGNEAIWGNEAIYGNKAIYGKGILTATSYSRSLSYSWYLHCKNRSIQPLTNQTHTLLPPAHQTEVL